MVQAKYALGRVRSPNSTMKASKVNPLKITSSSLVPGKIIRLPSYLGRISP